MKLLAAVVVTLALLLGGCGRARTPTPGPTPTPSSAITVTPGATATRTPTPTPTFAATPGATPTPALTAAPVVTPTPTPTAAPPPAPTATPGRTSDTTPPTVTDITLLDISPTHMEYGWATSEPATCQMEYGRTMEYGLRTPMSVNLTVNHAALIDGLEPYTPYHFRIRARDAAGNESVSEDNVRATYHHI